MGSEFPGLTFDTDVDGMIPDGAAAGAAGAAPKRPQRGPAAAAARAAAEALCVRRGEDVLARMGRPPEGGCRAAAVAQLRAAGVNLLLTYAALRHGGGGMAAQPQPWDPRLQPPPLGNSC
jgi:hypothetical protein